MKTIFTHLNLNNNGINQSISTRSALKNLAYYQDYDLGVGGINRNAHVSQLEHERDICEKELYRLRYGIENLLANTKYENFQVRQERNFSNTQNPFQRMNMQLNSSNCRFA